MQLELKDKKGIIGTIEIPLEQLKKALGLGSASAESKALLKENEVNLALLKESQDKVAELEEKLAKGEGRTMGDFTPTEKADFVINWAKGLSAEDKAIFAGAVGIPITKATDAEVAEGKPDTEYYRQFGCRYCEHLVDLNKPGEKWIGGCRYGLSFPSCGKWEIWSGLAEVAEAEAKRKAEEEGDPLTIPGKTDRPGYKYLAHLNISVKEEEAT